MSQPRTNESPGVGAPGLEAHTKYLSRKNSTLTPTIKNVVGAPLIRAYAIEQADLLASLSISFAEATWRENDTLASIHLEQIRLVGRELVRSFGELMQATGGAQ